MLPHQKNEFYVYVHRRSDTGRIFYVGKGWGCRGENFDQRSDAWKEAWRGTNVRVEVICYAMNSGDALDLEASLIDFILAAGGKLTNQQNPHRGHLQLRRNRALSPVLKVVNHERELTKLQQAAARELSAAAREQAAEDRRIKRDARLENAPIMKLKYKVKCIQTGMVFKTPEAAAKWLSRTGSGPIHPNVIVHAMRGGRRTAAGLNWGPA